MEELNKDFILTQGWKDLELNSESVLLRTSLENGLIILKVEESTSDGLLITINLLNGNTKTPKIKTGIIFKSVIKTQDEFKNVISELNI